jgi:hypothetical protein
MKKLPYQKPEINVLGDVDKVTLADYKYGGDDGLYGEYMPYSYGYKGPDGPRDVE